MITPRELLQTHFDQVFRGYHPGQVDEFIRRLVSEYETLKQENTELKDRLNTQLVAASVDAGQPELAYQQHEHSVGEGQLNSKEARSEQVIAEEEARARLAQLEQYISNAARKLLAAEQESAGFNRRMRVLLQEYMSLLVEGEQEVIGLHELASSLAAATDEAATK